MSRLRPNLLGPIPSLQRPRLTIGIRREDPRRIWERRTPLTPEAVHHLVSRKNVSIHIEPCDRRVFPTSEYVKAGATVQPKLTDAHIIIGIKETPINELITSPVEAPASLNKTPSQCARTHLMFSHTAKGQLFNTPLLSRFVQKSSHGPVNHTLLPRLIDYELLTSQIDGKRTVGFGWFAGVAGVLESLSAMAHSHLENGIASPFLYTPRPHTHPSLDSLRAAFRAIGDRISEEGSPRSLGPFVIGLTGTGNVAKGCLSMLSQLPIVKVSVEDLNALVSSEQTDLHSVYLVHAKPHDYLVRLDGGRYDRDHYYQHPASYTSTFGEKVAPYLTLFLNGAGWSPSYPRLMTNAHLTTALRRAQSLGGHRFRNIGDISCDVEGGLQFLTRSTTLSSPFYATRPPSLPHALPAVQIMAVDILPASIPFDASKHFSQALVPYLESLVEGYTSGETDQYSCALDRATIAAGGKLDGKHGWLQEAVDRFHLATGNDKGDTVLPGAPRSKKVLMLGSGMVAGPAVNRIAQRPDVQLLVASNSHGELEDLAREHTNIRYRVIDVANRDSYEQLIEEADVVISLLPVALHTTAAELCLKHQKHLVTASYISDSMRALHDRAIKADVLLLNEIGLDPGIDHCSAISLIRKLQAQGKQIVAFTSFCGGLPAPDVSAGPLRYKFSWSPRGVLSAALNPARFKLGGEVHQIAGGDLLRSYFPDVPVANGFELEGIPNRDSLPYAETYNLGPLSSVRTLLRGTLRYPGFSNLMQSFKSLGLLETDKQLRLDDWASFVPQSIALKLYDGDTRADAHSLASAIRQIIPHEHADAAHDALHWLGLLPAPSTNPAPAPLPPHPAAPLDILAHLLTYKLRYARGERDMVLLSHEVVARPMQPGASADEEIHTASLVAYGTPAVSAMARTVGLPVAIAALEVLDGKVAGRGVAGPGDPEVYGPVLRGLEEAGMGVVESQRTRGWTIERKLGRRGEGGESAFGGDGDGGGV